MDKFEGEERMLKQYEFFMELMKKFDDLGERPWRTLLDEAEGEQELKVGGRGRGGGRRGERRGRGERERRGRKGGKERRRERRGGRGKR